MRLIIICKTKHGSEGAYLLWCFNLIPPTADHIKSTLLEIEENYSLSSFFNSNVLKVELAINNGMLLNIFKALYCFASII